MQHHRFQDQPGFGSVSIPSTPATGAFLVCPAVLSPGWVGQAWMSSAVYQLAYERALATLRPSRLERLQAVSWN